MAPALAVGDRVRIARNDAFVKPGTEGLVVAFHPETRLPLVALAQVSQQGTSRVVAFTPDSLTVISPQPQSPLPSTGKSRRSTNADNAGARVTPTGDTRSKETVFMVTRPEPTWDASRDAIPTPEPPDPVEITFDWTVFEPRDLYVTVSATTITISPAAGIHFAAVEKVELLFDRGRQAVAVRPVKTDAVRAINVVRASNGIAIKAADLSNALELGPKQRVRCEAHWRDDERLLVAVGVPFRTQAAPPRRSA